MIFQWTFKSLAWLVYFTTSSYFLLQVNPQYLAKLILEMPQQQSTKFIESVILTLYNYASNPREEFLLLQLFSTSLRQEIMEKVENMGDIVTGQPLAVKMVVDFHRFVGYVHVIL